ncbi:MAG TPA: DUF3822 family protein [Draconibacterium sp.]|nr:DUF3822 family protein [Draconibacterium sp.]
MYELVTDDYFDLDKTRDYILSIQVSLGGFSFSMVLASEKKLLALKHSPVTISNERFISRRFKEWLESEKLLQQTYKETRFIIASEKFTLVPEAFYNELQKREIIFPVLDTDGTEKIGENNIEKCESRLLYAIPPQLETALNHTNFVHAVKLLIENRPEIETENGMILWFNSGGCYLILYNSMQILLANHFKITHENDIVYYVLTTIKQLGVAPGKTKLRVAGEMAEKESVKNILQKYFASIDFLQPAGNIQINREKFNFPLHPFIHLFF